jgi:glycosyltransferase involved in cell wall biosynthesis
MAPRPEAGHGFEHRFVVPDIFGQSTGGTVFNRELISGLRARDVPADVLDVTAAERALQAGLGGTYWIDTLFLTIVPKLARLTGPGQELGLLAHYLPSLVRYGAAVTPSELSYGETAALGAVAVVVAPSEFMRETLIRLGVEGRRVAVVEPGRLATGLAPLPPPSEKLRAVVVAHLVAGKGVHRLLAALATRVQARDGLTLEVLGSLTEDAAYADACRVFARAPSLRERVTLVGLLSPAEVNERLAVSDVLLSASSMESYGMALAEARALGVPIVARTGGNVAGLVSSESGGELVADAAGVAAACVALCRDPAELAVRRERARHAAFAPRAWSRVAEEFLERVAASG